MQLDVKEDWGAKLLRGTAKLHAVNIVNSIYRSDASALKIVPEVAEGTFGFKDANSRTEEGLKAHASIRPGAAPNWVRVENSTPPERQAKKGAVVRTIEDSARIFPEVR